MVKISDYPQLLLIAWNRAPDSEIPERDALALYEANWRFVEPDTLDEAERALIERLVRDFGGGILHV